MSELLVLIRIAFRNLFGSFLNIIVGGIILVGTFFFVVGSSLLDNMDSAMSRSIVGSVGGNIQVYNSKSKDELSLFNDFSLPDLTAIPDFSKIKTALLKNENVKAVVPMGLNGAMVTFGNTVDIILEKLRGVYRQRLQGNNSPELKDETESLKKHIRHMIDIIQGGYKMYFEISSAKTQEVDNVGALKEASSEEFWNSFDRDRLNHLEFLENKISSIVPDADYGYISYLGTDLKAFANSFDRMEIVDGTPVPDGHRGLLLAKYQYEQQFKLKTAHRLDQIHEGIVEEGKKISKDPKLRQWIKENKTQTREILLQMDSIATDKATKRLQEYLKSNETSLANLLAAFYDTNDENFLERYKFFYDQIAPLIQLYRIKPGDMLTIKSFTKTGFVQSLNVKVYGTFQFKGLEKSGVAGGISLMDLMSFRDLYGYMTPDRLQEMKQIEASAGAKILSRDQVEADLFGGGGSGASVTTVKAARIDDKKELEAAQNLVKSSSLVDQSYTQDDIEKGMVLNAAIILKDASRLKESMKDLQALSDNEHLDLKVLSWQKAAGNIGQFVFVAKVVLYVAVFIIFIVALVIINNAVMMATLQRIREIGTMRAIGAPRSFVLSMVLVETACLGTVFGSIGALMGSALIKYFGVKGIAAANDFLYFFFSGPRLFPHLGVGSLVGAFVIVAVVTTLSALYPAIIATRVSPVEGMASED